MPNDHCSKNTSNTNSIMMQLKVWDFDGFALGYLTRTVWTGLPYHVCLLVVDFGEEAFGCHPFHRQLLSVLEPVVVRDVDVSGETEVSHFDHHVLIHPA